MMQLFLAIHPIPAYFAYTLFFFFSSRRRHTRYWRDWSSDVCSSDLGSVPGALRPGFDTGTGNAPGVAPVIEYQFADAFGYCPDGASGFAPGVTVPHPYHRYAGGPANTGAPLAPGRKSVV